MIEPITRSTPVLPITPFTYTQTPIYTLPASSARPELLPKLAIAHPFEIRSSSIIVKLSQFLERLHSIEHIYLDMLERDMDHTQEVVSTQLEKHILYQKEFDKAGAGSDYWDSLRKIAVCFFGAASIVVGVTLLAPGATAWATIAGVSMILSGGSTLLGNTLLDMQSNPKAGSALMMVGGAFGLIGSISSAILGIGPLTEVLGRVVVASLSVASNSAEAMKSSYKWQLAEKKASYTTIQKASEVSKEQYRTMQRDAETYIEQIAKSTENCISAQQQYESAVERIIANSIAGG